MLSKIDANREDSIEFISKEDIHLIETFQPHALQEGIGYESPSSSARSLKTEITSSVPS